MKGSRAPVDRHPTTSEGSAFPTTTLTRRTPRPLPLQAIRSQVCLSVTKSEPPPPPPLWVWALFSGFKSRHNTAVFDNIVPFQQALPTTNETTHRTSSTPASPPPPSPAPAALLAPAPAAPIPPPLSPRREHELLAARGGRVRSLPEA